MEKGYKYSAFISYKHADKKHAEWIQKKLEQYHLTAAMKKELGREKIKICRDETDFSPNILGEEIHRMLEDSNYLIVLCSKTLKEKGSVYVDDEISYFMSLGRPDHIILLMVDAEDGNEVAYIPDVIKQAENGQELLGINLQKDGRYKAFCKILARFFERDFDDFYKRETRRKKITILAVIAVAAIALAGLGLGLWMYYAPHTAYYVNYVESFDVPSGIGKLSKKEASQAFRHYAIITQEGKVRELRYENAAFRLDDQIYEADPTNYPVCAKYKYYEKRDSLESITFYDKYGKQIAFHKYNKDASVVQITGTKDSKYVQDIVNNHPTVPQMEDDLVFIKYRTFKTNLSQLLLRYDENGRVIRRYYAYGDTHIVAGDANGICGVEYEYDEKGRKVSFTY